MITPQELVQAGLYPDEHSVIEEALRVLWQERPQLRLEWAIPQYQTQGISLAKAAAVAGISFDRMKELLVKRMDDFLEKPILRDDLRRVLGLS
jgi:predicted HTH domain antitoxin